MANSLDAAVKAGVVTAEAAFCGLTDKDVERLVAAGHGNALVLIRAGRSRSVVTADIVAKMVAIVEGAGDYVRDVTGVAV
jgi:hypothetical protein